MKSRRDFLKALAAPVLAAVGVAAAPRRAPAAEWRNYARAYIPVGKEELIRKLREAAREERQRQIELLEKGFRGDGSGPYGIPYGIPYWIEKNTEQGETAMSLGEADGPDRGG